MLFRAYPMILSKIYFFLTTINASNRIISDRRFLKNEIDKPFFQLAIDLIISEVLI
jgi:hypothetical protein